MNAYAHYSQKISGSERDSFEQALTIYCSVGGPTTEAFAQVERGLIDRYYRRKKAFPEEMAEIDRKARAAALHQRDGQLIHWKRRCLSCRTKSSWTPPKRYWRHCPG